MVINYIIMAHKQPAQLKRLVDALSDRDTYFYVHIDREVDSSPFEMSLKDNKNVFFLTGEKKVTTVWGSIEIIKATISLMKEVVKDGRYGYTVLMSGQCYPIKSNDYIRAFFENNEGINFIEGFKLPHPLWSDADVRLKHYTFYSFGKVRKMITVPPLILLFDVKRIRGYLRKYLGAIKNFPTKLGLLLRHRSMPGNLVAYGGMAYWAMPLNSIRFIVDYVKDNPQYLSDHTYTLYPDEVFIQTIVWNFLSNIDPPVTYASWPTSQYVSPKIFTSQDLEQIRERTELFARKFDIQIDEKILDMIDIEILGINPNRYKSTTLTF